jgi:membrane protease YdiL (CAAX protease family)
VLNAIAFAFRWYGGIRPLPTPLLPTRLLGAAASAVADELQFRSIVLGMLIFAEVPGGVVTAVVLQALLYGLAQRRLWRERQWYFLIGSVILGYALGWVVIETGSVVPAMVAHFAVIAALFAFAGGRLRTRPI